MLRRRICCGVQCWRFGARQSACCSRPSWRCGGVPRSLAFQTGTNRKRRGHSLSNNRVKRGSRKHASGRGSCRTCGRHCRSEELLRRGVAPPRCTGFGRSALLRHCRLLREDIPAEMHGRRSNEVTIQKRRRDGGALGGRTFFAVCLCTASPSLQMAGRRPSCLHACIRSALALR